MSIMVDERGLPEFCLVMNDVDNVIVLVKRDEVGFYPYYDGAWKGEIGKELADEWNQEMGITKAQVEAMKTGSIFGFHVPGALPETYHGNGSPKR